MNTVHTCTWSKDYYIPENHHVTFVRFFSMLSATQGEKSMAMYIIQQAYSFKSI